MVQKEEKNQEDIRTEIKKEKKTEVEEQQVNEYISTLKRLQADFENYIKRTEKEKQELTKYATHKFMVKLLKVMDDYDKALEAIKPTVNEEITKGLDMIHRQLHRLLEDEGVIPIPTEKIKFDPYKHEVIDMIEGEEDNIVMEEIQKGYMINDKVLRTSKVKISKKK